MLVDDKQAREKALDDIAEQVLDTLSNSQCSTAACKRIVRFGLDRAVESLSAQVAEQRKVMREAFAWGLDLRHKKNCPQPASNFQKGQPCKCGRDVLYDKLNELTFAAKESGP